MKYQKYGKSKVLIGICQDVLKRATSKTPTCQKLAFRGISAQLCSYNSIQILVNLTWV